MMNLHQDLFDEWTEKAHVSQLDFLIKSLSLWRAWKNQMMLQHGWIVGFHPHHLKICPVVLVPPESQRWKGTSKFAFF